MVSRLGKKGNYSGKAAIGPGQALLNEESMVTEASARHSCWCRELWHRASLAWRQLLQDAEDESSMLIVAHNAVNQVLPKPPLIALTGRWFDARCVAAQTVGDARLAWKAFVIAPRKMGEMRSV